LAISRKRKQDLVAGYVELLKQSKAVFLSNYNGLGVKQMEVLRGEVRKADGAFQITKNTLLALALKEAGLPAPMELLEGQVAAGFALKEAPSLAKAMAEFADNDEQFELTGGIMGSDVLSAEQIKVLAKLPSIDELRAQIIGLINGPARGLATVIGSGVRQVVNVLDAYSKSDAGVADAASA